MSQTLQYLTDEHGDRTAVVLPIGEYEKLLEDLDDLAFVAERRDEPVLSHDEFLADLRSTGVLQFVKCCLACCVLLLAFCLQVASADEVTSPVELQWHGKLTQLDEQAQTDLRDQAVRLVESSNFHSGDANSLHNYMLPGAIPGIQREYRATVAGNYIIFNFLVPQKIRTVGGEIMVSQIVIGLNREDFASNLFTVNESNGVVSHGKYAGEYCISFLKALKRYLHAD